MEYDRAAARQADALHAFMAQKAKIDAALARLAAHSADHFDADPDTLHWGHVATLGRTADLLTQITDMLFAEGEHAQ